MPDTNALDPSELRLRALSRWDNEGGALASTPHGAQADVPDMTNAELVQLRIRVIALENLMIAVLADGSDRQLEVADAQHAPMPREQRLPGGLRDVDGRPDRGCVGNAHGSRQSNLIGQVDLVRCSARVRGT